MSRQLSYLSFQISTLILAISWWVWSFTQTDPNLYYSSTSAWVRFQQFMWQINRPVVVACYVILIAASFALYFYGVTKKIKKLSILLIICTLVLLTSNNALSHDIYNYMFNAKAVAVYHQDPHVHSALEIAPHDDWVRFMHNVHTTAPYGHVWTDLTLVPYYLGLGKFVTTYFSFKLFMAAGFGLLTWIQWKLLTDKSKIFLFVLNPLVLFETLSSGHNDVWMMAFATASFALLFWAKKIISWQTILSALLLILSTQIKEATLVVIPVWVILLNSLIKSPKWRRYLLSKYLERVRPFWAEISVLLMFIPLFTARSQQFNPWYLIWPLTFIPFVKSKSLIVGLIAFSLTSLLRYVPFLFVGEYTDAIQWQMRLITWSAIPVAGVLSVVFRKQKNNE